MGTYHPGGTVGTAASDGPVSGVAVREVSLLIARETCYRTAKRRGYDYESQIERLDWEEQRGGGRYQSGYKSLKMGQCAAKSYHQFEIRVMFECLHDLDPLPKTDNYK